MRYNAETKCWEVRPCTPPAIQARIVELRLNGLFHKEIVEATGISQSVIHRVLKKHQLTRGAK